MVDYLPTILTKQIFKPGGPGEPITETISATLRISSNTLSPSYWSVPERGSEKVSEKFPAASENWLQAL
jgi:hypothetical protein